MSAVEAQNVADSPSAGHVEPAPAPIAPVHIDQYVNAADATTTGENKTVSDIIVPTEEKKIEKAEAKATAPIYSGALGYKAPGLKNAFRFAKKYFWFGEEPVPASNLREYLRGEKPEVAHSAAAWSSHTGKGLLYFVKHADQKEHPAGILHLAYATDLVKDGAHAFSLKLSGSKHTFEAQSAAERDGWFVAIEKAIAEAKEAKDGIESSDAYKQHKETIGKPTALAAATASTSHAAPKKSTDATPALASTETPATATEEAIVAAPARGGSSSSSSNDEAKKAKKAKSRSVSRGKRASIFGGLLGKKDKADEKVEAKKHDHKDGAEVTNTDPVLKDESVIAPPVTETSTTAPVITQDIPKPSEELKTEATPAALVATPIEALKVEESTPLKSTQEKPKAQKRASIFGNFKEFISPSTEKKESDMFPPQPVKEAQPVKEIEPVSEASKPLDEAVVAVPPTIDPVSTPAAPKVDEVKPQTPSKERKFFSFLQDKKSPTANEKIPAHHEPAKVDAVAPQIHDTPASDAAPFVSEPIEPIVAAPVVESKPAEPTVVSDKKIETPKKPGFFGNLTRSISKATRGKETPKEKKEVPTTVPESTEEHKTVAPVVDEAPAHIAPTEKSIGDVIPEAVTNREAPKSTNTAVTSSA